MRTVVGLFGLIGGGIIIWNVGKYGYQLSDNDLDGYMWGSIYGGVTLVGIGGFALGAHLGKLKHKAMSLIIYLISFAALIVSLTNAHSAMTGRGNATQAARLQVAGEVRDARRDLESSEKELETLRALKLEPATWSEVEAAQSRAKAKAEAKKAECDVRGRECVKLEAAEEKALGEVAAIAKRRATADRVKELEPKIEALKETIKKAGPVLEANIQGTALVRLFGLDADATDRASAIQNAGMATLWEVAVAMALLVRELLGETKTAPQPAPSRPVRLSRTRAQKGEPKSIESAIEMQADPLAMLPAPARKPIARGNGGKVSNSDSIIKWYKTCVAEREGARHQAGVFRESYEAFCEDTGATPAGPKEFGIWIGNKLTELDGGKTTSGGKTYYMGIRPKLARVRAVG